MKKLPIFKQYIKDTKGSAAIEFSLVAALYLLFMMGVLEFALITFGNAAINNTVSKFARAAQIGCTYGECGASGSTIISMTSFQQDLKNRTGGLVDPCGGDFQLSVYVNGSNSATPGLGNPGDIVEFCACYNWPIFNPALAALFQMVRGGGAADTTTPFDPNRYNFMTTTLVRNEDYTNPSFRDSSCGPAIGANVCGCR